MWPRGTKTDYAVAAIHANLRDLFWRCWHGGMNMDGSIGASYRLGIYSVYWIISTSISAIIARVTNHSSSCDIHAASKLYPIPFSAKWNRARSSRWLCHSRSWPISDDISSILRCAICIGIAGYASAAGRNWRVSAAVAHFAFGSRRSSCCRRWSFYFHIGILLLCHLLVFRWFRFLCCVEWSEGGGGGQTRKQ